MTFNLNSKHSIDPFSFCVDKQYLTKRQVANCRFMNHLITNISKAKTMHVDVSRQAISIDSTSQESTSRRGGGGTKTQDPQRRDRNKPNPVYGYKIVSIKASKPGTVVYRLRRDIFKQFLS